MALFNYATLFASGGFAGDSFDIAQGHPNSTFSSVAGDAVFAASTKTITLTAGTWPAWIQEVGKKFVTDSINNPGPFTVVSVDGTQKILTVLEAVVDETPAGATLFDGSINPCIIDNLLKSDNGVLETDAPFILYSTGSLGAARTLDLSNMEAENTNQGGEPLPGRMVIVSVTNDDITPTNSITVSGSTSVNGNANYAITTQGDYIFTHIRDGIWRANILPRPAEGLATIARVDFTAADWAAGTANEITVIKGGTPGAGEVGPHNLTLAGSYIVDVINTDLDPDEKVEVETQFDPATGNVTIIKACKKSAFNGTAVIVGSLD